MFIAIFEEFLVLIIFKIAEYCSKLPFSKIYLVTPDFWMIVFYYAIIAVIIYLFNLKKISLLKFILGNGMSRFFRKNYKKIISLLVLICLIFQVINLVPKDLKIYFVDVAQRRLYSYKK